MAGAGGDTCLFNDYNAYTAPNSLPKTPVLYWGKHLATIHGAFRDAMFAQATADLGNSTFANNCSYMAYNMGGTGIYADWAETRNINQYKRGGNVYHYSVSSMYFENPGRIIDHTTGSRAGLRMILNGRKKEIETGLDFSSPNVKTGVAMNDCNRNQLTYFINTRDLSANNIFIYADAKLINANIGNSLFSITIEDITSNSIISTDNYVVNAGTYTLFERVLNGNTAIALAANKEYKITVTFMDKNVLINKIQVSITQQTASTGSLCVSSNPNPVVTPNVPLNQQLGTIFTGNTTTNNICYTISTSPASFCIAPNTNQPVVISLSNSSYTCTTNVDIQNVATITTSASPICEGVGITLYAPTGTGLTYQWKNNGVNISYPSGVAATYPANYAGDYTVTVTDANACSTTSAVTTVLLNSLPTIDPAGASGFIYYCPPATGVQLTANLPTGAPTVASYDWLISNTHYVNPNNHTNTIFGSYPTQYYLVQANYTNGCSRTSGSRRVQIGTNCRVANPSDEQSIAEELFSAYPNPTSGQLSVELQGMASENGSLKLYNYLGQVVVEQTISLEKGAAQLAWDIQKLAPGIYDLMFESQDKKMSKKIVKE